jgi:ketose-bisphosphate aldolase
MSLVPIKDQLYKAQANGYAVPMFDVFEMQGAKGIFEAIAEKKAPAIVAVYAHLIHNPDAEAFAAYLKTMADGVGVPVSIMLDHGQTVDQCMQAISFGFTDVMFDGSELPFEENIAKTCEVVRAARPLGIGVEAELGHVGNAADYEDFAAKKGGFTDPASVPPFVEATGVDFLAVAFGTAHGVIKGRTPQIDLDLLKDIRTKVDLPLVMHGGSGVTDQQFREVIAAGITKINLATNLVIEATIAMKAAANKDDANLFTIAAAAQNAYKNDAETMIDLFGTKNQGERA